MARTTTKGPIFETRWAEIEKILSSENIILIIVSQFIIYDNDKIHNGKFKIEKNMNLDFIYKSRIISKNLLV